MALGDGRGDGKAEAAAAVAAGAGPVGAVEALEDELGVDGFEARPLVRHLDHADRQALRLPPRPWGWGEKTKN